MGISTADDAGVYRLTEDLAIVQTVDLFPPVVDDPYDYGQIAVANSLSDIYAMGATPITALNIVGWSPKVLPAEVLVEILRGGADKAKEAEVVIIGGHTLRDSEPKYGIAVTGVIQPHQVVTNANAQPGDFLVLTKPIGTGIITTALKADKVDPPVIQEAVRWMATLNRSASIAMQRVGVNSATDITGFGLLGHLYEMAKASQLEAEIELGQVPIIEGTWALVKQGIAPGGTYNNLDYLTDKVEWPENITEEEKLVLCDAQTSGGLLISVPPDRLDLLITELKVEAVEVTAVIGRFIKGQPGKIRVRK